MKLPYLLLALPLLSACSVVGFIAKESAAGATSHYGLSRTTLITEVPASHAVTYTASYAPADPQQCTYYSPASGGSHARRNESRSEQGQARASAQTLTFKVPLAYHIGSCTQHLKRITVSLVAPDGLLSMSDINVMPPMPGSNGALRAPDDEVMVRRLCGTAFHIVPGSTRHLLRKAIDCLAADTQWQPQERTSTGRGSDINVALDQLKHTDLRLIYRLSEAQWPLYPSHWMPVENGMKPCASPWKGIGESTCGYGQQTFSTFEMEGRQCSVYPGCT